LSSDEIDLFELFHAIWKRKKWLIGCTLFAGLLGVGYAYLAPQVYQVSSVLRPAAINELDALNRSEVYKLPPVDALAKVGARLESYEARLGFFRANPALFEAFQRPGESLEQSFEAFNKNAINLTLPDPKNVDRLQQRGDGRVQARKPRVDHRAQQRFPGWRVFVQPGGCIPGVLIAGNCLLSRGHVHCIS